MSKYRITVDGKTYEMDVELIGANGAAVQPVAKAAAPVVSAPAAPAPAAKPAAASTGAVIAPMPGTILKVLKASGDAVKAGDVVLILEAMKMENEIFATASGTVSQIRVSAGDSVNTGDALIVIG